MKVLDAFRDWFTLQTGIPTLFEPERLANQEPTFRLNLAGFEAQGENREKVELTGTLSAQGDAPDFFLDQVIDASRAMLPYREGAHAFDVEPGFQATATITRTAPGRFEPNQDESKTYGYSYFEQFRVELSYNPAKLT